MDEKNSSINNKNKRRKKPAKIASSSPGFGFDEESDEDHALFSQRKRVKRQKASPPAISMEDGNGSGEDGGGADWSNNNGKVVSHITVERNRRKQMNEHLAVLRQLMPCFYVKKGDQASIIGGVIDYINELQQVLQSLEAKKQRMIYTNEVGQSPRLLVPQQQSNPSPLINLPVILQSTSPYKPLRQPLIQINISITSPTSNTNSSCSSIADMSTMTMNIYNNISNNAVANELCGEFEQHSSIADVEVQILSLRRYLQNLLDRL